MKLNAKYIKFRDKWWALPLILPCFLLPLLASANSYTHISSGNVTLFYLPLALMISLMLFFGWGALPGIILSIFLRKYHDVGLYETLTISANFVLIIVLSWGGYRVFVPRRSHISHGNAQLLFQRLFWQVFARQSCFCCFSSLLLLSDCMAVAPARLA